jgi:hypothetical protein
VQLFPKSGHELRAFNSVQTDYAVKVNFHILLNSVGGINRNEVYGLRESVHNYPIEIMFPGGEWQADNEVHAYILPLPQWYG